MKTHRPDAAHGHTGLTTTIQEYLLPIVRDGGHLRIPTYIPHDAHHEVILTPGTLIGDRHIVEEWIGNFSITQVYRVRHKTISTFSYILKTLRPSFAEHQDVLAQFHAEASALARLHESLAPQVIDMGVLPDGRPFQCLEAIGGLSLEELTRIHGPQPEPVVWHIAADVLSVIDEMHQLDMTHGNLQPESIRLWKDPSSDEIHPRILDFSTIQAHNTPDAPQDPNADWAWEYRALFPSRYLAPDCLASRNHATCDVYSIGLVMAELLDGAPLHVNDQNNMSSNAAIDLQEHGVILGPFSKDSAISTVLQRALHPDPHERYANAGEMLREILTIARNERPDIGAELSQGLMSRYTHVDGDPTPIFDDATLHTPVPPPTQDAGTARMYKVPTKDTQSSTAQPPSQVDAPTDTASKTTTAPLRALTDDHPDAPNRRGWLIFRICLVVAFMIAALSLLFLGVPM